MRQNLGRDARPVVGDDEHDGGRLRPRLEPDARRGAAIAHRVADEVCQHLVEEDRVRRREGQPRLDRDLEGLRRAAALRRRHGAVEQLADVDPVAVDLERAGLDPGHGEEVAHHAVEILGFVLDLAEEVAPCRLRQPGAVVDEARRGAEDRGERGAEIVADRGQERVADALGLGRGARGVHLLGEPGALERGPRLVAGAAGDGRGEDGNREQDEQRQKLVRLGDREGVQRLDEEEVVGEERQSRGEKRRPEPEARGGEQHGEQEHHRDVRQANEGG